MIIDFSHRHSRYILFFSGCFVRRDCIFYCLSCGECSPVAVFANHVCSFSGKRKTPVPAKSKSEIAGTGARNLVPVVPPGLMIEQCMLCHPLCVLAYAAFVYGEAVSPARILCSPTSTHTDTNPFLSYMMPNISGCPQTSIRSGTDAAALPPSATLCVPYTRPTHSSSAVLFWR